MCEPLMSFDVANRAVNEVESPTEVRNSCCESHSRIAWLYVVKRIFEMTLVIFRNS